MSRKLICKVCGHTFNGRDSRAKYCSSDCQQVAAKAAHRERERRERWIGQPPPKRFCVDCGCPTDDYRCPQCWLAIRSPDAEEDYLSHFSGSLSPGQPSALAYSDSILSSFS